MPRSSRDICDVFFVSAVVLLFCSFLSVARAFSPGGSLLSSSLVVRHRAFRACTLSGRYRPGIVMSSPDANENEGNSIGRRQALLKVLSVVALGATWRSESVAAKTSLVGENPNAANDLFTAKWQNGINKRTQRLFGCQTQTNCVSVSANKNPTQFMAPWDYTTQTQDAETAWKTLKSVVSSDPTLKVVDVQDDKMYLRAEGVSKVPKDGVDDVEFLMVPKEKIVTYRSASRGNFYVYPYQVPIGDGGFQKDRIRALQDQLGWAELNYAGSGVYTDGCGPKGDKKCNAFGGLIDNVTSKDVEDLKGLRSGSGEGDSDMPRADKFRLPW